MKEIVITGGNTGIGYETARSLAAEGHRVTITTRSKEKGEEALSRIREECNFPDVSYVIADLADFTSIREASRKINKIHPRIDVLIHNAGTFHSNQQKNKAGIELTFMVNHIAPFYLTHLLLPSLNSSEDARIICVNSDSHFQASFDPENLTLDKRYHGLRAYARSKLANILFTYEFERRNPHRSISIYVVHPGLVNTDIGAKHTTLFHRLIWNWRSRYGKTPAEGADTSIFLATADRKSLNSGTYWDERKTKKSSKASYNEEYAQILWERSMEICDLERYF